LVFVSNMSQIYAICHIDVTKDKINLPPDTVTIFGIVLRRVLK
jgi:hypothetical protein